MCDVSIINFPDIIPGYCDQSSYRVMNRHRLNMFEQYFGPPSLEEETEFMPLFSVEEEPNLTEDVDFPDVLPIL